MKKVFLKLMVIILLSPVYVLCAPASAPKTKEIKSFAQVLDFVKDKDTVLVLSLDNTLLKSPLQMGQRAWFYHRKTKYLKSGLKETDATQKALAEWTGILNLFGQQPVANDIAK